MPPCRPTRVLVLTGSAPATHRRLPGSGPGIERHARGAEVRPGTLTPTGHRTCGTIRKRRPHPPVPRVLDRRIVDAPKPAIRDAATGGMRRCCRTAHLLASGSRCRSSFRTLVCPNQSNPAGAHGSERELFKDPEATQHRRLDDDRVNRRQPRRRCPLDRHKTRSAGWSMMLFDVGRRCGRLDRTIARHTSGPASALVRPAPDLRGCRPLR